MTDRQLLKGIWKDLTSQMALYAYLGDFKSMLILSVAEKIRAHINKEEGCGWDKQIIDEILDESNTEMASIISREEKKCGICRTCIE